MKPKILFLKNQEGIMKKLLSLILSLLMMTSAAVFFPLRSSAEEQEEIVLPEFTLPTESFSTFEEIGFPYDEALDCFPEIIEIKYEDGAAYVKDLGGDHAYYTDRLNSETHEGVLVDGYWRFDVTLDEYNSGGYTSMYTDSRSWHAEYYMETGKRGIITLDVYNENISGGIMLYPTEGYGEQYVTIHYYLYSGLMVRDTYEAGAFVDQQITLITDDTVMWAEYDKNGEIISIEAYPEEDGRYVYFIPDMGWSEYGWEYVPIDAPKGFEDATTETFKALMPTDIGCEHQCSEALCDVPSICTLCLRTKGAPLGHKWVSGDEYDTCSACNGIRYRISDLKMPSVKKSPALTLKDIGIDFDEFISRFPSEIITKYENGVLSVPSIDGCGFDAYTSNDYFDCNIANGWISIEISEEELEDLEIEFSRFEEHGEHATDIQIVYGYDGKIIYAYMYDSEYDVEIDIDFEDNVTEVFYYNKDSGFEYTDIYENGNLRGQEVCDSETGAKAYYDSDLKIIKGRVYVDNESYYYVPNKGWFENSSCTEETDVPEGHENTDEAYFAKNYPTTIDFCIHDWKEIENGKECTKCGEKVVKEPLPIGLIIGIAAGVVVIAAATVTVIIVKKKKTAK